MKKNMLVILATTIAVIAVLWGTGLAPKGLASIAAEGYAQAHFPEMQLECRYVEWAPVYGDYLVSLQDKDGNTFSCVIGPSLFPIFLGQGLFAIEEHYTENYQQLGK